MVESMEETDYQLLVRYQEGHVEALEQLVERYRRPLFAYISGMTGWGAAAESDEVFQDVWLRVIRHAKRYRDDNFGGWLMRIARNLVLDRARRRKPDVSLDQETEAGGSILQRLAGAGLNPEEGLEARDLGARIAEAVARLPGEQKEVFLLRAHAGVPFREIARMQKVSINTALARMQYALAKLRPLLKPEYEALGRA
jgi:RNA polymerase sigma-70 factor (ECF subfamily)